MVEQPQTWHDGLLARWWAEFNAGGPEGASFPQFIERDGQPALDVGWGAGRLLLPDLRAGLDVDGCDVSPDMLAQCRELAARAGLAPRLSAQARHNLALPRTYRPLVACGSFGLGGNRPWDVQALRRMDQHRTPGGRLVLDNAVPDAQAGQWQSGLAAHRGQFARTVAGGGDAHAGR
jgi:SAM-dependent methyltransferase